MISGYDFWIFPQIHRLLKSGKLIHKNKDVEMWKTPLKDKKKHSQCGKLKNVEIFIQNKCELFYNS